MLHRVPPGCISLAGVETVRLEPVALEPVWIEPVPRWLTGAPVLAVAIPVRPAVAVAATGAQSFESADPRVLARLPWAEVQVGGPVGCGAPVAVGSVGIHPVGRVGTVTVAAMSTERGFRIVRRALRTGSRRRPPTRQEVTCGVSARRGFAGLGLRVSQRDIGEGRIIGRVVQRRVAGLSVAGLSCWSGRCWSGRCWSARAGPARAA